MRRPPDLPTLRAAWWTVRALRHVRRGLDRDSFRAPSVPEPPAVPVGAGRGVNAALRRRPASCLERALVLQRWEAAQGRRRDIVIGVTAPADFSAHAWLDGDPAEAGPFTELVRIPAP
jgi:hypothetical protein